MSSAIEGGVNGRRRRPHSTTVPEPWQIVTRPVPRDIIAERVQAEVRRYWWRTMAVAAVILVMQVGLAVAT